VDQKAIHDNQGSPEETTARSPEADENQTMIKRTKVLDEKVGSTVCKVSKFIYFSKLLILFKTYSS